MTRQQQAMEFFIARTWSVAQAAGIVANLEAESALRPDAIGDGGLAYGLAQWHADRQARFFTLMGRSIKDSSFEEQIYFVHAELRSNEKSAGDALAKCTTASEAGACVSQRYERPRDREGEATKRAMLAQDVFLKYTPQSPGATMSRKPPFTIDPALYQGRDFDPVVKLSFDMAGPTPAQQADIGKEGIACLSFVAKGNPGSTLYVAVSPHPFTSDNQQWNTIYSITETEGDFSHSAVSSYGGGIGAVVIAAGTEPPRGQIGIVAGTEYFVNVAHVLPIPYTGGLLINPNAFLK